MDGFVLSAVVCVSELVVVFVTTIVMVVRFHSYVRDSTMSFAEEMAEAVPQQNRLEFVQRIMDSLSSKKSVDDSSEEDGPPDGDRVEGSEEERPRFELDIQVGLGNQGPSGDGKNERSEIPKADRNLGFLEKMLDKGIETLVAGESERNERPADRISGDRSGRRYGDSPSPPHGSWREDRLLWPKSRQEPGFRWGGGKSQMSYSRMEETHVRSGFGSSASSSRATGWRRQYVPPSVDREDVFDAGIGSPRFNEPRRNEKEKSPKTKFGLAMGFETSHVTTHGHHKNERKASPKPDFGAGVQIGFKAMGLQETEMFEKKV